MINQTHQKDIAASLLGTAPVLSPRRRRLRWTIAFLAMAALISGGVGTILLLKNRPALYRPDEKSADITSTLAKGLPAEAPRPRLTDVTREAGLSSFRSFVGERSSQLPEDMGSGAAWGDYDNDGDDDLFLVSAGGSLNVPTDKLAASELYENLGNGSFRKAGGFPELRIRGMAAAWGDYDGDGFLDLAVTGYNTLLLFHNEHGLGKFERDLRFPDLEGYWAGIAWGDYDNDRDLDLYVCGYVRYTENDADRARASDQLGTAVPYTLNPASYDPALNLLFRNNGDGTLTELAEKLAVTNPTGRSLGALWHDLDDDGWLDLYIANDISDNAFYRNTGGAFEDISHAAWVADYRSAMGLAAGDYNRDGDDDLFVTHWVAQENALYDNLWADFNLNSAGTNRDAGSGPRQAVPVQKSVQTGRTAGSPPHVSEPKKYPLRFMDLNEAKGLGQIALPFVGWGTEFADFDGDGWLDLVVANGSTLEAGGPPPRSLKPQEAFLFWNQGGEFFHDLAPLNKSLSEQHVSRGLAVSDYDNDGDVDVVLVQLGEGVQLFRNDMQTGHWLKVRLRSRSRNGKPLGFGDGAKVIAHVGGASLRRTVSSVSYLSQSSRTLHFGLGLAKQVDNLEVRWLGGQTNYYTNLSANTVWELTEGEPSPKRLQARSASLASASAGSAESPAGAASVRVNPKPQTERAQLIEFWNKQRGAMDALKIEKDIPKAIALFRKALELNPSHEDSRYYLGNCLAMQSDWDGALEQLQELTRINPQSHRGHSQWGTLRALSANSEAHLAAAEESLEMARRLNPEETGALLVLGEVALLRGEKAKAEERLANVCRTNPRAVAGLYLQGYLAWKRGDASGAQAWLSKTREALGKEWQPKGTTAEGDVRQKWHVEKTPLSRFWDNWDGSLDPGKAFAPLDAHLLDAARSSHEPSP